MAVGVSCGSIPPVCPLAALGNRAPLKISTLDVKISAKVLRSFEVARSVTVLSVAGYKGLPGRKRPIA